MTKSTRAGDTLEFKEEAVRLVKGGERPATVAKNLSLAEPTRVVRLLASAKALRNQRTITRNSLI